MLCEKTELLGETVTRRLHRSSSYFGKRNEVVLVLNGRQRHHKATNVWHPDRTKSGSVVERTQEGLHRVAEKQPQETRSKSARAHPGGEMLGGCHARCHDPDSTDRGIPRQHDGVRRQHARRRCGQARVTDEILRLADEFRPGEGPDIIERYPRLVGM